MTPSLYRKIFISFLMLGSSISLSACRADLYSNLNEESANKMLATLSRANITAHKAHQGRKFSIQVSASQFEKAQWVLENAHATPSFLEKKPLGQTSSFPLTIQAASLHANRLKADALENLLSALVEVQSASVQFTSPVAPRFSVSLPQPDQVNIISSTQAPNAPSTWIPILQTALQSIPLENQNVIVQQAGSFKIESGLDAQDKNQLHAQPEKSSHEIASKKLGPFWVAPGSFQLLQSLMIGLVVLCLVLSAALFGLLLSRRSSAKTA